MKQFVSYAQNQEDAILDAYFKDVETGFYVDIGAHHPVMDSVTKNFYEKGWRGINVEPNPRFYKLLCEDRPQDINVQAGISDQPGKLSFRIYANSGLSTFSAKMKESYVKSKDKDTKNYKDVEVPTKTLKNLLDSYKPKHIHFMKIDVEGFEYEVLSSNDWKIYRPEMVCIEANHVMHDWRPILENNSYELVWNDGLNDYYLARESSSRKNNFSYAETMLTEKQIIPYHVLDKIEEEQRKNQVLGMRVDYMKQEIETRDARIADQQRVRTALKLLLLGIDKAIQFRLNALQATPQYKKKDLRHEPLEARADSPGSLLDEIQTADLKTYYSNKKLPKQRKKIVRHLAYKLLTGLYSNFKKIIVAIFRGLGLKR